MAKRERRMTYYVVRAVMPFVRDGIPEDVLWHFRVAAKNEADAVAMVRKWPDINIARDVFVSGRTI
jgi:hypothetical protein